MRKSIGDDFLATWFIFHREVEPQQLAHPMVLWNGSEALVQQKLQAVVVSFDDEHTSPKIWPLVVHGVRQTNELPLISGERSMTWSNGFAEIGNGAATLMQDCPETRSRCITLHNK